MEQQERIDHIDKRLKKLENLHKYAFIVVGVVAVLLVIRTISK